MKMHLKECTCISRMCIRYNAYNFEVKLKRSFELILESLENEVLTVVLYTHVQCVYSTNHLQTLPF